MTVQVTPWQETFNNAIKLSISEQLQLLSALANKLGFGNKLSASLNGSDYIDQESNLYERSDSEDDVKQKTDSECSIKYGDGEPYSFLKTAPTLNLDGPPDWSENVDAYLYGGKSLDAS